MPDFITTSQTYAALMSWLDANAFWVSASLVLSAVLFIASPFLIAWIAVRLPKDYFVGEERSDTVRNRVHPVVYILFRIIKNLLGVVLILAGIAMLVLPGQGILTILIGLSLIHFPGKYRLEQWLVSRPAVFHSINWIRNKAGVPDLMPPEGAQQLAAK